MTSIPQPFYVYVLARPNGRAFYVGKGRGRRIFEHDREARSGHDCHKCNVIRKIWKQEKDYQRYTVFTSDDEQAALNYECELIALYGLENLTNLTIGGEGTTGHKHSAETKQKIRAAHLGYKHSKETRQRMSEIAKNRTKEHNQKISASKKGKPLSEEHKLILSKKNKGRVFGDDFRKKISDAKRGTHKTEAQRQAMRITSTGKKHTDESKRKMSIASKGRMISDETRRIKSEAMKASWVRRKALTANHDK